MKKGNKSRNNNIPIKRLKSDTKGGKAFKHAAASRNGISEAEFEIYLLRSHGLQISLMRGDGNCLFRSIAHQLGYDPDQRHYYVRQQIVKYMKKHSDFYSMFVEDDVTWDEYLESMSESTVWGGYQELCAAASAFNLSIHVYQWNEPKYVIRPVQENLEVLDGEEDVLGHRVIMLSFHDGCHYNSLRPADISGLRKVGVVSQNEMAKPQLLSKSRRKTLNSGNIADLEVLVHSISRSVSWTNREEIIIALEWVDGDENEAIELLCSQLHSIRALLAASTTAHTPEIPEQSSTAGEGSSAFATEESDKKRYSKKKEKAKAEVTSTVTPRVLSKKELRQKERQDRERTKKGISVSIPSEPKSSIEIPSQSDGEVLSLNYCLKEIVI